MTTSVASSPMERLKVILAGMSSLVLTVGLARFAYTPLLPIMRDQAGLTDLSGGWLATINYAGYMLGTLLAASVSDVRAKFWFYRAGLLIAVVSTAAMGLTHSVVVWAVLRFAAGVSATAGLLFASGLVLNWLVRHGHRRELGLHFMGLGLGIAVSGVAVALMSQVLRWDGQWFGLGAIAMAVFVPAWWWMPAPSAAEAATASTDPAVATPGARWTWLLTLSYFAGGFGFAVSATFIVAIVGRLPEVAGHASWVWVLVGLAATPASYLWDKVAGALGHLRALMLAYALQALSTLWPAVTDNLALNLLAAALFGITFVGIVSLTLTLVGRRFPANPAKSMARMTLSYGVAQIMAPAISGTIATVTGSYRGALALTAIILVIAIGLLQAVRVEERRS